MAKQKRDKKGFRLSDITLPKLKLTSIRSRGMVVSMGLVLAAIAIAVGAFSISVHTYYYTAMRSALTAKAETASDFFTGYVSKTYAEYYQSAYSYAENFEDKDKLELQFVNTRGQVEVSSSGISGGYVPDSGDIQEAIRSGEISVWRGKRPSTGEHIMAVSAPLLSSDGSVVRRMRSPFFSRVRLRVLSLKGPCLSSPASSTGTSPPTRR